jgi:hypothetical protein
MQSRMAPRFKVRLDVSQHEDEYEHQYTILDDVIPESITLQCPHCSLYGVMYIDTALKRSSWKFDFICSCPNCQNSIFVEAGYREPIEEDNSIYTSEAEQDKDQRDISGPVVYAIWPNAVKVNLPPEVPLNYHEDYREARLVLLISPKSSAALGRRILQHVLREEFQVKPATLVQEIKEFVHKPGVPSYLVQALDNIRLIGNFAAHPLKDSQTSEIIEVEPGEAEWVLTALDLLFDHAFVKPRMLDEISRAVNVKHNATKNHS